MKTDYLKGVVAKAVGEALNVALTKEGCDAVAFDVDEGGEG